MISKLQQLSKEITDLIDSDDFTTTISPKYLLDAVKKYPMQGGKRVRVALLLWSCGVLDGAVNEAYYHASAIEIWHNWTLVHDDIIDQDCTRRGELSTHMELAQNSLSKFNLTKDEAKKFGENFAILCGDLQQSWANNMILKGQKKYNIDPVLTLEILAKIQKLAAVDLISGEALDVEFSIRSLDDITVEEVMQMIDWKTGALFRCACEIGGALAIGTFNDERIEYLSDFATNLGLAFQLQDDYLGTFGDFKKLGKDIGSDIREKKPTVLLLKTLENASDVDKRTLYALLGSSELQDSDLELIKSIMENSGAVRYIKEQIAFYMNEADVSLQKLPDNQYRNLLIQLSDFLFARER